MMLFDSKKRLYSLSVILSLFFVLHCTRCEAKHLDEHVEEKKDCGPKCLLALVRITKAMPQGCDIPYIYRLIGKETYAPTNLKDLQDAAVKLGFRAKGYKLSVKKLKKIKDYAILPLVSKVGTSDRLPHFILIAGLAKEHALIVDYDTLKVKPISLVKLQKSWNGMALIISSQKAKHSLPKPDFDIRKIIKPIRDTKNEQIIDLGKYEAGSIVKHSIVITNKPGEDSLYEIVGKSCSCIDTELKTNHEGKTILTVTLHVTEPGPKDSIITVASKNGEGVQRKYKFRLYGNDAVRTLPKNGYFKAETDKDTYLVVAKYFTTKADTTATFEGLETDIPGLKWTDVVPVKKSKGKMTVFEFKITLSYSVAENQSKSIFSEKVNFLLNTSNGERSIPFDLTIEAGKPQFQLVPKKLFMRYSKSSPNTTGKTANLKSLSDAEIQGISMEYDESLPIKVVSNRISDQEYMIKVNFLSDKIGKMSAGLHKGKVLITPKDLPLKEPLTLPVVLLVYD